MTNEGATMNIPEEVLQEVAEAIQDAHFNFTGVMLDRHDVMHYARAALSAAAPLIAKEARRALIDAIESELNHAAMNEHELSSRCQGVAPGEHVPAVRISNIEAAIEGATKEQS